MGSAANANVAKDLLEQKLGYTGYAKDYKKYIDGNNGVVDGGQTGVIGQIGWWIPTYMLTDYPDFATQGV